MATRNPLSLASTVPVDYAADTRSYTYGLVAELYIRFWVARFGEMLMPTVANGIQLDWNIARARGGNFEFEYRELLTSTKQLSFQQLAVVYDVLTDIGKHADLHGRL